MTAWRHALPAALRGMTHTKHVSPRPCKVSKKCGWPKASAAYRPAGSCRPAQGRVIGASRPPPRPGALQSWPRLGLHPGVFPTRQPAPRRGCSPPLPLPLPSSPRNHRQARWPRVLRQQLARHLLPTLGHGVGPAVAAACVPVGAVHGRCWGRHGPSIHGERCRRRVVVAAAICSGWAAPARVCGRGGRRRPHHMLRCRWRVCGRLRAGRQRRRGRGRRPRAGWQRWWGRGPRAGRQQWWSVGALQRGGGRLRRGAAGGC